MNSSERQQMVTTRRQRAMRDGVPRTFPLYCNGSWREFPVWLVPTEALLLNADNKRFTATRTLVEEELGRPLDPENVPADEDSLIAMLLDKQLRVADGRVTGAPSKDYEALKADWAARTQAEPLWIRPDGVVRNGNRRLAMLRRSRLEGDLASTAWVEAVIIEPQEIDEAELFRMEQEEQMASNFKVRYEKIDSLLALKEAAQAEGIDWADSESIETVAGALKHYAGRDDKRYAAIQLRAIRAIDAYLAYLGRPGAYHLVMRERQVEVFREVGKIMALADDYPDDIAELMQTAFAAVQSGMTYQQLRQLRRLFLEDRAGYLRLAEQVQRAEQGSGWPPADPSSDDVINADLDDLTAEDPEDEDDDPAGTPGSAASYPRGDVNQLLTDALDAFATTSMETLDLLQQAANRLAQVTTSALEGALAGAQAAQVREAAATVLDWARQNEPSLAQSDLTP